MNTGTACDITAANFNQQSQQTTLIMPKAKQSSRKLTNANPKPDTMPDRMQAFVLFKSGHVLNLRFNLGQDLSGFKDAFESWGSNPSGKHQVATFQVCTWNPGNATPVTQSLTINWEAVAAINFAQ